MIFSTPAPGMAPPSTQSRTRFFLGDIDVKWFPEACRRQGGFHTVM
jgi:hypothetical protein